jgi:hypothetical protein
MVKVLGDSMDFMHPLSIFVIPSVAKESVFPVFKHYCLSQFLASFKIPSILIQFLRFAVKT